MDVSLQVLLSSRRSRREKLEFKPLCGGGIFGGAKQNQQGMETPIQDKVRATCKEE